MRINIEDNKEISARYTDDDFEGSELFSAAVLIEDRSDKRVYGFSLMFLADNHEHAREKVYRALGRLSSVTIFNVSTTMVDTADTLKMINAFYDGLRKKRNE